MLRIIQLFPKETLNKSFLQFFTTLSVTYFRALLKTAKRMLRIIQLFPKIKARRGHKIKDKAADFI